MSGADELGVYFSLLERCLFDQAFNRGLRAELSLATLLLTSNFEQILNDPMTGHFVKSFLALHLLKAELDAGRYLWRRIPKVLKDHDPELAALWVVIRLLLAGNQHEAMHALLTTTWSPGIGAIAAVAVDSLRTTHLSVLPSVYSCISLSDVSRDLGIDEQTAQSLCVSHGWTIDGGVVTLVPAASRAPPRALNDAESLLEMTRYVSYLERKSLVVDLSSSDKKQKTDKQGDTATAK
jgi:hypothetical protein